MRTLSSHRWALGVVGLCGCVGAAARDGRVAQATGAASAQSNTLVAFAPRGASDPHRFPPPGPTPTEQVDLRVDHGPHPGATLHLEIYRPDTSAEPTYRAPVILFHSPANNPTDGNDPVYNLRYRPPPGLGYTDFVDHYVRRGYAVAITDVRGTAESGGCYEMDGPNQARDVVVLVDYLRTRPWSNGRVAGVGYGINATALVAGATLETPAQLTTMVLLNGLSGLYQYSNSDGVPHPDHMLSAAGLELTSGLWPMSDPRRVHQLADRLGCMPGVLAELLDTSGDMTPFYQQREWRPGARNVTGSVLVFQGLRATGVRPLTLDGWFDRLPTFHRGVFGLWGDHSPEGLRSDYYPMLDAWFDHFLLDLPTGVASWPAVQVEDELGLWRAAPSYAELGARTDLVLGDGVLGDNDPVAGTTRTFHETDVGLEWSSPPRTMPQHLSGQATLEVTLALDRDDAHFAIELQAVTSQGEAMLLTRGYRSARHRASLTHPTPVPIGVPQTYTIRTQPFDAWITPGSRLRLVLRGFDESAPPAGSGFTARVAVDGRSVLRVPVVGQHACVRTARTTSPAAVLPGCEAAACVCADLRDCRCPSGLSLGALFSCAAQDSGRVVCWGQNASGQLGDGTTIARGVPTEVAGLTDATAVAAGDDHACARRASGEVVCWGDNGAGQLGDGTNQRRTRPVAVAGLADAVEVVAGRSHTCARRGSGSVVCWGGNNAGQLGDGTTTSRATPVAVLDLTDAVELTAGRFHTCARRASGDVVCWGHNGNGQLGDGTTTLRTTPVAVATLTDAAGLSAGKFHTCARRASGEVACWGLNASGQLGDGTTTLRTTPVAVVGLDRVIGLATGWDHSCARRSDGTVRCWGHNASGQLGDGTTIDRTTPTPVRGFDQGTPGGLLPVTAPAGVATGASHSCARRGDGQMLCWGHNASGQLGDGTTASRTTPVVVRDAQN